MLLPFHFFDFELANNNCELEYNLSQLEQTNTTTGPDNEPEHTFGIQVSHSRPPWGLVDRIVPPLLLCQYKLPECQCTDKEHGIYPNDY